MPSWRLQIVVSISARQAPGAAAHPRLRRLAGRQLGDEKEEAATAAHNLEANAELERAGGAGRGEASPHLVHDSEALLQPLQQRRGDQAPVGEVFRHDHAEGSRSVDAASQAPRTARHEEGRAVSRAHGALRERTSGGGALGCLRPLLGGRLA